MKKITLLLLMCLPLLVFSQIKKQSPAKLDSITVKGAYKIDTIKVYAIVYAEDDKGFVNLIRLKGYVITNSFTPVNSTAITLQTVLKPDKWEALKPDDVYDIKQFAWK